MKKLTKAVVIIATVLALAIAALACGDAVTPPTPGPATYTVTYVIGEGATGAAPTEGAKAAGAKFNLAASTGLAKADHTFGGWNDGTTTYQAGAEYTMPEKNVTLTAVWTPNEQPPATYTVTYVIGEGATGTAPTEGAKAAGAKFNLAASTGLAKADHTFGGWNDGTTTYQASAEYTMPGNNVTLTAVWTPDQQQPGDSKYTVTYEYGAAVDDDGHAITKTVVSDVAEGNYTVGAPKLFSYYGDYYYYFAGWTVKNAQVNTVYMPGQTYNLAADTTLVAQWKNQAGMELVAADKTESLVLYAYDNGTGALILINELDPNEDYTSEAYIYFTYTISGSTVTATPLGGEPITGTLNDEGELTMNIRIGNTSYEFAPSQIPAAPTFTVNLNGGAADPVPSITATADMYNKNSNRYSVPMPAANVITPPAGKTFRRWKVSDGVGEWTCSAGGKFQADPGTAYTVTPEWNDSEVAPVVPTGTEYTGNWNTPAVDESSGALGAVPSVNVTKVWLDLGKNKLYYAVGNPAVNKEVALSESSSDLSDTVKSKYGADASLYNVKIETLLYNLVVTADKSKLAFADTKADISVYNGSEFVAEGGGDDENVISSLDDVNGVKWNGSIIWNEELYDSAEINNSVLTLHDADDGPNYDKEYTLSEMFVGGVLYASYSGTTNVTVVFDDYNYFTIEISNRFSSATGMFVREGASLPSYTVTLNPNNTETPEVETQNITLGNKVEKPVDPVHSNGKHFRYWMDEETGDEYDFDSSVTSDLSLVAFYQWKVTFEAGDGATGTVSAQWVSNWTAAGVLLPAATRLSKPGYVFAGWSDGESDTLYQPNSAYVGSGNVTLTAQWTVNPVTYTVTYVKPNGVDGEVPQVDPVPGTGIHTLVANPFTKEGWDFYQWQITSEDKPEGELKVAGYKYTINENIAVTPVFQKAYTNAEQGTLRLLDNEKAVWGVSTVYDCEIDGTTVTLTYGLYEYKFEINDSDKTFKMLVAVEFLKPDGATGEDMPTVFVAAGEYTLPECTYAKDGWTFLGWMDYDLDTRYDDPVVYAAGTKVILSDYMTYIAVFAKTYTSVDDANVKVDLRDDGYAYWTVTDENWPAGEDSSFYTNWSSSQQDENLVIIGASYTIYAYLKLNGTEYAECDELLLYTFTANDGTILSFDGRGKAYFDQQEVGTYELTFTYDWGWYPTSIKLTIGGNDYNCQFEDDSDYNRCIVANIVYNEKTYVFDKISTYIVTYTLGDGVVGEAPNKVVAEKGTVLTLNDGTGLTKEGFTFAGWQVDGAGSVLTGEYTVNADVTLVAAWTDNSESGEDNENNLLAYYFGTSEQPIKYGFSSCPDSEDDILTISSYRTYAIECYRGVNGGVSNCFVVKRLYLQSNGSANNAINALGNDGSSDKLTSDDVANVGAFTTTSNVVGNRVKFEFSIYNGKRVVKITYGNDTVTWTEITA